MAPETLAALRDRLLIAALPLAQERGWTDDLLVQAAQQMNNPDTLGIALFPGGIADLVAHFSDWADRAMMEALSPVVPEQHRVRDRVRMACMARFRALAPYKGAVAAAARFWSVPPRPAQGARLVWRTADRIWQWAGDTAMDYNRYTKRVLLSGVLGATAMAWLGDTTNDLSATESFLDRRIDQVVQIGGAIARFKRA